ncbi:MAG: Leucine-rich repeat (LRR) protein [Candidatus Marinamargulisbacteria bacterium]|jgi:Leucine-rich repeat (LRR) protein
MIQKDSVKNTVLIKEKMRKNLRLALPLFRVFQNVIAAGAGAKKPPDKTPEDGTQGDARAEANNKVETFLRNNLTDERYISYSRIPMQFGGISRDDRLLKNIDAFLKESAPEKIGDLRQLVLDAEMSPSLKVRMPVELRFDAPDGGDPVSPSVLAASTARHIRFQEIAAVKDPRAGLEAALARWVETEDRTDKATKRDVKDTILEAFESGGGKLDLAKKELTTIPPLVGLTQLKGLDLSGNRIRKIPENAFDGLNALEYVNLNSNGATSFPLTPFQGLHNLEFFRINGHKNCITDIPAIGPRATLEKALNTWVDSDNGGEPIDKETAKMKILNAFRFNSPVLRLDGLGLGSIPPLEGLSDLTDLRLNDDGISEIPADAFKGLPKLKTLHLNGNKICDIDKNGFQGLDNLEKLELSFEGRSTILAYQGLTSLTALHINGVREHPPSKNLRFYLEAALTRWVETELGTNEATKWDVKHKILRAFDQRSSILDLSNQGLRSMPPLIGLTELEFLTLSGNKIPEIPEHAFHGLTKLTHLHFHDNRLRSVSKEMFEGPEALPFLTLTGNGFERIPEWATVIFEIPSVRALKEAE